MTRLEEGYVLVDELADERQAAKAVGSISLKTGEPAGIRTQDPRLKRAFQAVTIKRDHLRRSAANGALDKRIVRLLCDGVG